MTLQELKPGESAVVTRVGSTGSLRQHFLDMGIIPGECIELVKIAPMGDPIEFRLHSYELTLRKDDASYIEVDPIPSEALIKEVKKKKENFFSQEHPGLGEEGKYHVKESENPLPKGETLSFALVGNQNCGKTTLFNQLTGSNQHVGNFPGVTVDEKSGIIRGYSDTCVTDLPGIYSLSPYTSEEIVSRQFILNEKPKGIINIVDATAIERNLYLTLQLLELNIPMVLAVNMMDEMRGNGGTIDINKMEEMLGIPVVPIAAAKNEGVEELILHAVHVAKYQEKPGRNDFCDKDDKGGAVHRAIHSIMHLIEDHAELGDMPIRFAACKLVEGDIEIANMLRLTENEKETIEHLILQMEEESGLDRSAAMADMRYSFIHKVCNECVVKPNESREHLRSKKIDQVLTGKYTAIPSFLLIMCSIFAFTFILVGPFLQEKLEAGIQFISQNINNFFIDLNVNHAIRSLVIDGIFAGVGSVLSFLPIILLLFLFLSILEDSGYMARVAFVTDKPLRKIGLSGRSIVPMLVGFGCTVPSIMSSRTLPSARDRKMTIMLTPFMTCTAKLPIYAFFANAFFPKISGLVIVLLYVLGIVMGIITALISKKTLFKGEAVPFVMELPNYRMPGIKNVAMLLWEKAKDFLQRAFTVIFIASIAIWALQSFDFHLAFVEDPQYSILAIIAGFIAPIFTFNGFADWRFVTALTSGFLAKESVVSTIEILFKDSFSMTTLSALSFLVFCLLYTPCIAAVSAVKRELGHKWAFGMVLFQCLLAWISSMLVFQIGSLFV